MRQDKILRPFEVKLSNGQRLQIVAYNPGDAIASAVELSTDRNVSVISINYQHEF